jgi:glycosyltransferase involved in cell wall biosynthesis
MDGPLGRRPRGAPTRDATVRVAFPTPATFDVIRGGGERYPLNLARGLVRVSEGDVEVELIAPARERGRERLEDGVWLRGYQSQTPGGGYGNEVSWDLVEACVSADVVHVHQVFTRLGEAAVLAARAARRPLCVTDHGGPSSHAGRKLGLAELADAIVVYSRYGAAAIGARKPVSLIEGGVDTSFYTPAADGEARDHVVFVGRIMPHKGVDVLIRACPPDVPLVIAGTLSDPDYTREVRQLARHRNVTFVINADDDQVLDLYRRAFAVALSSVHVDLNGAYSKYAELMGLTLLEGMACGTPALCFRTGALPEYVDHGETGFIADDVEDMTRYISLLASDPALVRRMGAAARQQVVRRWDIEIAATSLLRLYGSILDA